MCEKGLGSQVTERHSKADEAYFRLRAEIESGELEAGQSLSENSLVERLGISRTPIRDALSRLLNDGLATRDGARGSLRVSTLSVRGVRDLFEYRIVLEGAATRQLAEAIQAGSADPEGFRQLKAQLTELSTQRPEDDRDTQRWTDEFYQIAENYDQEVIRLTPNPLLSQAIADLRPHTLRLRTIAHRQSDSAQQSLHEHLTMMDALIDGDSETAEQACVAHLRRTMETIFLGLAYSGSSAMTL